jgi:predicted dehydrogenase
MSLSQKTVRVGVLGCGPIAQCAHLDAVRKAKNAELYAICDSAPELLARMEQVHQPKRAYADFDAMLDDPMIEAVVIAVDDRYHAAIAEKAIDAGKHILIEKPLAVSVEECQLLRKRVRDSGLVFQIGNNRRFHPGWQDAKRFLNEELGNVLAFSAWYHDSVYRYAFQDNLYPVPVTSDGVKRPDTPWKEIRERYYLITHGSHLLDTARYFLGEIVSIRARHTQSKGAHCWTIDANFVHGCQGQLRLIVPAHADFEEGLQIYGDEGSIEGRALLPWFQRATVECFKQGRYSRVLGEDGFTFKRQMEAFAATVLEGAPQLGATVDDGLATVRGMVAVSLAIATDTEVRLSDVHGGVLSAEQAAQTARTLLAAPGSDLERMTA